MALYDKYNQFAIPEVNFAGNVFKPQEVKFEAPDSNITARALAVYEERQNRYNTQNEKLGQTFATLGEHLSNDAETQTWFKQQQGLIETKIGEAVARGDYHEATKIAAEEGAKFANNTEYKARVKSYDDYKAAIKAVEDNKNLNPTTIQRFKAQNQYKFKPVYDEFGQVISTKEFIPNIRFGNAGMPVDDIVWGDTIKEILSPAQEQKISKSVSKENATDNYYKGSEGEVSSDERSSTRSSGTTTVTLSKEKILQNADDWINRNHAGLQQALENVKFEEQQLKEALKSATTPEDIAYYKQQLEYYKQFHNKDNFNTYISEKDFANLMIKQTLENAARYDIAKEFVSKDKVGKGRAERQNNSTNPTDPTNPTNSNNVTRSGDNVNYGNESTVNDTPTGGQNLERTTPTVDSFGRTIFGN